MPDIIVDKLINDDKYSTEWCILELESILLLIIIISLH